MGQLQDREPSPREQFDENSNNGFILGGKYIPEEIITDVFLRVDINTLLKCQLVCMNWKNLIQSYIWRRRAEMTLSHPYVFTEDLSWKMYYLIAKKKPFERNLIKNHSGQYGVKKHWKILSEGGDCWKVENPCEGVPPLPKDDPVFQGKDYCFVTSYNMCSKVQIINLEKEGLPTDILDILQPPIKISEWYSCRWDCPADYELSVKLLADDTVLDAFKFREKIVGEKQNKWLHVSHVFKNYGRGLKKITFSHGGLDKLFWAGHYGSKMAGACVCVKIPESEKSYSGKNEDSEETT